MNALLFFAIYHSIIKPRWTSLFWWVIYWCDFIWLFFLLFGMNNCIFPNLIWTVNTCTFRKLWSCFIWAIHIRKLKMDSLSYKCHSKTGPLAILAPVPTRCQPEPPLHRKSTAMALHHSQKTAEAMQMKNLPWVQQQPWQSPSYSFSFINSTYEDQSRQTIIIAQI